MESLILASRDGSIRNAEVALVISNVTSAAGLETAKNLGVETLTLDHRGISRDEHDHALALALASHRVDLVCLAGYMRLSLHGSPKSTLVRS